jgi:hypothetical protein
VANALGGGAGKPRRLKTLWSVARRTAGPAIAAMLVAGGAAPALGQGGAPTPGSELTISLMTMGVGPRVWERFGHNAIVVEDRLRGTAKAYNSGLFDFRQEDFLLRFVQGRMWYWMQGFDATATVESYVRANRSVWMQELELTPAERRALADFLEWNERPENRFYRYDYYRDNCSTRVRDALDRVLHGRIRAQTDTIRTGTTSRWHTARLTASDLPLYTALQLALGQPADRQLTAWDEMFIPLELRDWARKVTVVGEDGRIRPLVRSERLLFLSTGPQPPARPPRRFLGYLLAGVVLGGALVLLARGASRPLSRPGAVRGFSWLAGGWALIIGVAGGLLAFLWGFTDHAVASRNENVLQANLLLLPLAVLAPRLARGKPEARGPAVALALMVAALSVLGVLLKALPGFYQANAEVLALAVPVNLGLALSLWLLGRAPAAAKRDRPA